MTRLFKADGVEVNVTLLQPGNARIDVVTTYHMDEKIRWEVMRILKEFAVRSKTRPQIGRKGGFCTHIDPVRAEQAARQLIRRTRLDQLFAIHEEIRAFKAYVR